MEQTKIGKIAVLTSGGDSPGMNACIRAVVRKGIYEGLDVYGVYNGYEGLINGSIQVMRSNGVSNIIQRGGTILKTARSKEFRTKEGMLKAHDQLKKRRIDGLIVIGGDGTFRGGEEFGALTGMPVVGVPGTIDNDLYGTDNTIGYDTALNTVVQAVDKIRDTADSHERLFFIEVMGRDAGFIALRSAVGVGAEAVLIPERKTNVDEVIEMLEMGWQRKKTSSIIIVAEGEAGGAFAVAEKVKSKFNQYDVRVTILGHVQRGGSPTCLDRVLASQLGVAAVESLLSGQYDCMVGIINKKIVHTPFCNAVKHHQDINRELLALVDVLSV